MFHNLPNLSHNVYLLGFSLNFIWDIASYYYYYYYYYYSNILVISRFQWLISTQGLVTHDVHYHRDPTPTPFGGAPERRNKMKSSYQFQSLSQFTRADCVKSRIYRTKHFEPALPYSSQDRPLFNLDVRHGWTNGQGGTKWWSWTVWLQNE